jgi:hypothetical protein
MSAAAGPPPPPASCPVCAAGLLVTRLQCPACSTEVSGTFQPAAGRLVNLPEPYASLLELFLRVRGNVKDVERELGLSYPTVRARLEEAFAAARPKLAGAHEHGRQQGQGQQQSHAAPMSTPAAFTPSPPPAPEPQERHEPQQIAARAPILDALERGEITAAEAVSRLRALKRS